MRSIAEIHELLDRLNEVVADELEDQDLDFKEWKGSVDHMVKLVVESKWFNVPLQVQPKALTTVKP